MRGSYCLCLSGGLGDIVLRELLEIRIQIEAILTNKDSDTIIKLADDRGIPVFVGNPRNGRALLWLHDNHITFDNILSVNYLFILEPDVLNAAQNVAVNFHGSLLPKYRGRTPHVWAIINGEKQCGITAHLMNAHCDEGDIVKQVVVPIEEEDTGAAILHKYNALYPGMVMQVVEDIEHNNFHPIKQNLSLATYFGKRTPEDGEINWDWQKERIRNWVRAQANPYPGAFTYLNGLKIIINKVMFSDKGFMDTMTNGLVVDVDNEAPYVKTQNGVIALVDYQTEIKLQTGDVLGQNGINNQLIRLVGGVKIVNYINCNLYQQRQIYELRNHSEIRKWMTNPEPILWNNHLEFIELLSKDSRRLYFAIFKEKQLMGTYNLSLETGLTWERGIITSPDYQGKGTMDWENAILTSLPKNIFSVISAKVKHNNIRSQRYHEKAGYTETGRDNEYIYYNRTL